jgi:hypothetical protein
LRDTEAHVVDGHEVVEGLAQTAAFQNVSPAVLAHRVLPRSMSRVPEREDTRSRGVACTWVDLE